MDRELMRHLVQIWKHAGPELEAVRRQDIVEGDNVKIMEILEGAFNHAVRSLPPRESSGLVEMQRLFSKLAP